ncbi:EndoU domain-containing protein [filamentous cyanobacterium LEGE 11480]|uniref:EndoU domain-containing protein n=2 Tax=Romeriopsis TaxID=2992131 RepID=A0A928Z3I4_9CYAN|nr:EndoU domain-containing protein [Romeriopsis navalis LEGE 11480]
MDTNTETLRSGHAKPKLKSKPVRPTAAQADRKFQPFFDQQSQREVLHFPRNRSVDATPPMPSLNKFDRQALVVCGDFGSRVDRRDLRRLFEKNPAVVKRIRQAVDGEIFPGRQREFLDDLVQIWTVNYGFEHIFCGDIKGGEIGGLHYVGRYAQLQEQGLAGRLADNQKREEVQEGEVYTIGVEVRVGNQLIRDTKKGYAYVSNAEELLRDGTWAFKHFPVGRSAGTQSCLYTVRDDDTADSFEIVFVKTAEGIVTMYPDATPPRNKQRC